MKHLFVLCLTLVFLFGQSSSQQQDVKPSNLVYPVSYNKTIFAGGNDLGNGAFALNGSLVHQPLTVITSNGDLFLADYYPTDYGDHRLGIRKVSKQTGLVTKFFTTTSEIVCMLKDSKDTIYLIESDPSGYIFIKKLNSTTGESTLIFTSYSQAIACSINSNDSIAIATLEESAANKIYIFNISSNSWTKIFGKDLVDPNTQGCNSGDKPLDCQLQISTIALTDEGNVFVYTTNAAYSYWLVSSTAVTKLSEDYSFPSYMIAVSETQFMETTSNTIRVQDISDSSIQVISGEGQYFDDGHLMSEMSLVNPFYLLFDKKDGNALIISENYRVRRVDPITKIVKTLVGTGEDIFNNVGVKIPTDLGLNYAVPYMYNDDMYIVSNNNPSYLIKIDSQDKVTVTPKEFGKSTMAVDPLSGDIYYSSNGKIYKMNQLTNEETVVCSSSNTFSKNTNTPIFGGDYKSGLSVYQDEIYLADQRHHVIRKISKNGNTIVIAGNGTQGFAGDGGLATEAFLNTPTHAIVDSNGDLWIADYGNKRVRKVSASTGIIATVAGNGNTPGSPSNETTGPLFLAESLQKDSIYVSDLDGNLIKKIDKATMSVSIIAGNGNSFPSGPFTLDPSPALETPFTPGAIVVISENSEEVLYFIDSNNGVLRKLFNGTMYAIAGNLNGPTPALSTHLSSPVGLIYDSVSASFYVSLNNGYQIRKINLQGETIRFAGNGTEGFFGDGEIATGSTISPGMMAMNGRNLYFWNNMERSTYLSRIRYVSLDTPNATVNTFAGGFGDGLNVENAFFQNIFGMEFDERGNLYVLDSTSRIRKISRSSGIVSTIAGGGLRTGNGILANQTYFSAPSITILSEDVILVPDMANNRVFKISNGIVTNLVGNITRGNPVFGVPATQTAITDPKQILQMPDGHLIFPITLPDDISNPTLKLVKLNGAGILEDFSTPPISQSTYAKTRLMRRSNGEIFYSDPYTRLFFKLSPYCTKGKLNSLKTQCINECFGIVDETLGCSSKGYCIEKDTCTCFSGYNGTKCEDFTCNSVFKFDSRVCSGNGICSSLNNCTCSIGYNGSNCEQFECYGTSKDLQSVCSGKGVCSQFNKCTCKDGYYGAVCDKFDCFGIIPGNSSVCSSNGKCLKPNNCTCNDGYFGDSCESFNCKGVKNTDSSACSSRGQCIAPDTCKCGKNVFGANCEFIVTPSSTSTFNVSRSGRLNGGNSVQLSISLFFLLCSIIMMIK